MQATLKVQSSELGNLAGYGAKFCSPREAAEKFWKRNRPDAFKEYVRIHGTPTWKKKDDFVYGNANAKQIMEEAQRVRTPVTSAGCSSLSRMTSVLPPSPQSRSSSSMRPRGPRSFRIMGRARRGRRSISGAARMARMRSSPLLQCDEQECRHCSCEPIFLRCFECLLYR